MKSMGLHPLAYYIGNFLFYLSITFPYVITASILTKLFEPNIVFFSCFFLFYFLNSLLYFVLAIFISMIFNDAQNIITL